MSDDRTRVSPSKLAAYATCPRQYEYARVWDVATPERTERYLDRGTVYHAVLEDLCELVADDPAVDDDAVRSAARARCDERWERHVDPDEYVSDAQRAYDRAVVEAGIAAYLDDGGIEDLRSSVGTEVWLECERDDVGLVGRADNVVRTDDGLRVIDYKGSLNGIVSWRSADDVVEHRERDSYSPDRLKSVFQAATYIEGARGLDAYEPGMDVEFTFYGLLADTDRRESLDGIDVSVSGRRRDVADIYETYEDQIWALIGEYYERIVAGDYAVDRWPEVREHACEDCDYREMCAEYLAAEVRAGD